MDAADDLVQETLERAIEKWRFWQRGRELRPWLFSIMHNLHVDQLRHERRVEYGNEEDFAGLCDPPHQTDGLELRDLDRALALLPVEQREILLLVGLEELSYKEVAGTLGLPLGTVMSRLSRARAHLRAILAGEAVPHLQVIRS
ncbi:RNA polymerase sigma-70 factor, ECF subfamily [Noviherbaspirillum humi]|uniref:RNA polymerase sigma-70 factor, ECF subfamily n=2 Tax=Noviherbaspirillum humi TaxID=1688639 RepID=A0A239EY69_9BURK|nr:RNA polymerase sigma-70 factor, ECF subfamily [Noviherbaspirillum humi]